MRSEGLHLAYNFGPTRKKTKKIEDMLDDVHWRRQSRLKICWTVLRLSRLTIFWIMIKERDKADWPRFLKKLSPSNRWRFFLMKITKGNRADWRHFERCTMKKAQCRDDPFDEHNRIRFSNIVFVHWSTHARAESPPDPWFEHRLATIKIAHAFLTSYCVKCYSRTIRKVPPILVLSTFSPRSQPHPPIHSRRWLLLSFQTRCLYLEISLFPCICTTQMHFREAHAWAGVHSWAGIHACFAWLKP